MNTFPKLYKITSTGADQEWTIAVDKNTIITKYGQVGGAIQTATDVIKVGKNIGKKNETTPEEQALLEAEATWEKKLKKGYVKSIADARAGKVDAAIKGGFWPMLAHKYRDYGDEIVYPVYVQPKLDGFRCVGQTEDSTLWSRSRQAVNSMPHLEKALKALGLPKDIRPDGELYNHAYKKRFEELAEFIRASEPVPGCEVVQWHVYDVFMPGTFEDRLKWMKKNIKGEHLVLVETKLVNDEDELMLAFEAFLAQGYEGIMVRNANGPYKSVSATARSRDLLKLKKFDDTEFEVVGVEEGNGKLAGHAIFICRTDKGVEFRAKMKGEISALKKYWDDPSLAVGKWLTVKYQGYTKYGKPRFPVAWRFREDV